LSWLQRWGKQHSKDTRAEWQVFEMLLEKKPRIKWEPGWF